MQVTVQNNKSPANELNGRYYKTFTPQSAQELIKIHHMGCVGNTEIRNIQIEKGNTPTGFVEPKITQMETSGILNDLRSLNLMLTDVNSDLWGRIKATNKGMLTEFFNSDVKSAIATSANTITQQINSTLNGDYSSFSQRLDALRSIVKNEAVTSTVTQLADTYDRKIETANANVVSRVNQSISNVTTSVQELERGVVKRSDISVTSNGLSFGSSKVIDGKTLSSILNVTPNMITAITKQMKVTGDMLVNGAITSDKIQANSITSGHLASGSISASKLDVDDAFLNTLVAKDSFFEKMEAKKAFIHAVQAVDITSTQLSAEFLSAYKGNIGGFQIGQIKKTERYGNTTYVTYYPGKYITGEDQFKIGMSNGSENSPGKAALWVNWGHDWGTFPENGFVVTHDGHLHAFGGTDFRNKVDFKENSQANFYGSAYFGNTASFNGITTFNTQAKFPQGFTVGSRISATSGVYTGNSDVFGTGGTPRKGFTENSPVWWSQLQQDDFQTITGTASDRRFKKNITESNVNALEILSKINPVAFDYIEDNRHVNLGFIAQNIQSLIPEAVSHQSKDKDKMLYLIYQNFVPYLVKAIQQLSAKVEDLERKLIYE